MKNENDSAASAAQLAAWRALWAALLSPSKAGDEKSDEARATDLTTTSDPEGQGEDDARKEVVTS